MRQDMVKLQDRLSREIFSRRYKELDELQCTFVDYHAGEYSKYVEQTAPVLRDLLGKKLRKEYGTILDVYCKRLPPEFFKLAVDEGAKTAWDRGEVIFSVEYLSTHFSKYVVRYKKQVIEQIEGRFPLDIDYYWFYNIYRYIRENDTDFVFDPFWGFSVKEDEDGGR